MSCRSKETILARTPRSQTCAAKTTCGTCKKSRGLILKSKSISAVSCCRGLSASKLRLPACDSDRLPCRAVDLDVHAVVVRLRTDRRP